MGREPKQACTSRWGASARQCGRVCTCALAVECWTLTDEVLRSLAEAVTAAPVSKGPTVMYEGDVGGVGGIESELVLGDVLCVRSEWLAFRRLLIRGESDVH